MNTATEDTAKEIRRKPLFVAGLGLAALFLFLLATSRLFILDRYAELEERKMSESVQRALSGLANDLSQLSTVAGDYAGWDDTCRFIRERNSDYIRSNLTIETFAKLRLNVILFLDVTGRIVHEQLIDQRNKRMGALPDHLLRTLAKPGLPVRHEGVDSISAGIVMVPEGPLLVVSRPILTSEYKGPVRGALIMGRLLDAGEVARLSRITHLSIRLRPYDDRTMPPEVTALGASAAENRSILFQRQDPNTAAGYSLIDDIFGKPALVMQVTMQRDIYRQGLASIRYYVILVMSVGLFAALLGCILYARLRTAHDELERRVAERTAELREKDRMLMLQSRQAAMGEMIGNIAHQWRQPLNSLGCIVQSLPLMHESGELSRGALESMSEKVMGIILHMSGTIDDFRNYFKPDKEKKRFYVYKAVARTVSFIEESFRSQGISILVRAEGSPMAHGYPNEYAQVLLNILINARDAFAERKTADPKVAITIGAENSRAVVTISDNAGGISGELIDKIFEPYFTTKGPDKGTGVGLFMSKGIIERNMGGSLTVRNSGQGAVFRIEV